MFALVRELEIGMRVAEGVGRSLLFVTENRFKRSLSYEIVPTPEVGQLRSLRPKFWAGQNGTVILVGLFELLINNQH